MTQDILFWLERLLSIAIFFQTVELLQLKSVWQETGVWKWSVIRNDFSSLPLAKCFFSLLLSDRPFFLLLMARLISCIGIWFAPYPAFVGILFFSTWLISIRWRGVFNGGSDSMTAVVSAGLFLAQIFSDQEIVVKGCLAYIAIQVTLSYFIAGVVKIKNADWRSGTALPIFLNTPRYDSPAPLIRNILSKPKWALFASWAVILFECAFPLAWLNSNVCVLFLSGAFVFHICNFLTFGLNRFVFAWLAGYPALYYWSHR